MKAQKSTLLFALLALLLAFGWFYTSKQDKGPSPIQEQEEFVVKMPMPSGWKQIQSVPQAIYSQDVSEEPGELTKGCKIETNVVSNPQHLNAEEWTANERQEIDLPEFIRDERHPVNLNGQDGVQVITESEETLTSVVYLPIKDSIVLITLYSGLSTGDKERCLKDFNEILKTIRI